MTETNPDTLQGWPLMMLLATVFLINFLLSRWMTAKLIQNKFIKRNSIEFQKAFLMWFFPIVGFAGLLMLYLIKKAIRLWKSFGKWLVLN